mgnify:CR=1 FL=1
MINLEKLQNALVEYKKIFDERWQGEKYKWEAVKWFQDHWDINANDFADMFAKATEKTANLLASMNNFPRKMMIQYAQDDAEAVRAMFINLYDESKDVTERILQFQSSAQDLCDRLSPGYQHYQRPMAITVYLCLKYPQKYDIFKYTVCKAAGIYLENDFIPTKGHTEQNIKGNSKLISEMQEVVSQDSELIELFENNLDSDCYADESHRMLTFDLSFYIANYLADKTKKAKEDWTGADIDFGISADDWRELFDDESIFNTQSWEVMYRFLDYGGMATCKQLSVKYGETPNFYNTGVTTLAKRMTGCDISVKEKNGNKRYWTILFVGRNVNSDEDGVFVWKLRDELKEALEDVDFSDTELYADQSENSVNYWWLNANPKIWSFSDIEVGEEQNYTMYNDNGNKRRIFQNFLDAREGDLIIGYESNPVKQVVAICRVTKQNDGENLYFEKIEGLTSPIDYTLLKDAPELEKMEYFMNPQGSLFKLTKGEYDFIMDMVREENQENPIGSEQAESYSKEDFLSEVYMTSEKYDSLKGLLLNKKNIILQGAPGVGKTFAAKRLAYSIMGVKDESRVEFIQFHQNYSYEDFIMGYKPSGEGFRLYLDSFNDDTFYALIEKIKDLNFEIAKDPSLGSGFCIGHSYFCGQDECTDEWMQSVVEYDILPMLEEYWFDEPAKIQKWQNILRGVFND